MKKFLCFLLALLLVFTAACGSISAEHEDNESNTNSPVENSTSQELSSSGQLPDPEETETALAVEYGEFYYDLEHVVMYLYTYSELPPNYITKNEARSLGWEGGSVEQYKEGAAIGGDKFGNREKLLPTESGRSYTECDIDTHGADSRGAKRLVFSNDGLYFYTEDHYASFTEVTVINNEVVW